MKNTFFDSVLISASEEIYIYIQLNNNNEERRRGIKLNFNDDEKDSENKLVLVFKTCFSKIEKIEKLFTLHRTKLLKDKIYYA